MRKLLLPLLLLFSSLVTAQTEPAIIHDFYKSAKDLVTTFKLNDEVSVMQVNTDNDNFDVLAIDAQMKILWKVTLPGYALSAGKFKGKIVAVASTDYSSMTKSTNNNYKGFVLDPLTGKTITEKVLYTGSSSNVERAVIYFDEEGSYFRIAATQTALANRVHVALPGPLAVISLMKADKQQKTVTSFSIVDYDINLDKVNVLEPMLPEGYMLSYVCNNKGDFFIAFTKEVGTIDIYRFQINNNTPLGHVSLYVSTRKNASVENFANGLVLSPSKTSSYVAYAGLIHENADKEPQLTLTRADLLDGKQETTNELFTKDYVKELQKSFEPINKKIKDPNLGAIKYLDIRYLNEVGEKLIAAISGKYSVVGQRVAFTVETSSLVKVYDMKLKPVFHQLIPTECLHVYSLTRSYHADNNRLHIICTDTEGPKKINALFSTLNLDTGKWERMEWLINKSVDRDDIVSGINAMWFKNYCVIPYKSPKGLMKGKYEITLLQQAF